LAKANGLGGTYLLSFETSHPLRFQLKVGNAVTSLHAASAGKVILASLDAAALEEALAGMTLTAFTPKTITDQAILRAALKSGQAAGFHVNLGESIDGLTTISAPFHWQKSLYIVTVAAPSSRLEMRVEETGARLLEVCRKLEMRAP
jgi:IclR family pca regulon transcriptional regulator